MRHVLPPRPNLAYLKHQARELLTAYAAGDSKARQRVEQYLPAIVHRSHSRHASGRFVLAHALAVIAREYGFSSWPQLKQHVETLALNQQIAAQAVTSADRAQRRLAAQQRIALLAERVMLAAREQQLERLFAMLAIPARDSKALRAYLVEHQLYGVMIDALLLSVEHANARIRFWGAQAMDHFADQRCAEPLRRLLHDPVPRVRWAALHSLQCADCKLTPLAPTDDVLATIIELALNDPSIKVRRVATYELGQVCADPRAVATLTAIRAQSTDRRILHDAQAALACHARAGTR